MKAHYLSAALGLAALALAACDNGGRPNAASRALCADFKAPQAAAGLMPADGAGPVDNCVKRWAYALASSKDDATIIADAATTACNAPLTRWNQASIASPAGVEEAASLTTGQPTTPLGEHYAFAQNRALFYVVQARAGACQAPPIVNGAPEGLG